MDATALGTNCASATAQFQKLANKPECVKVIIFKALLLAALYSAWLWGPIHTQAIFSDWDISISIHF